MMDSLRIQKYLPKVLHQYIESFNVYHFRGDTPIQLFPKGVFEIVFQNNDYFEHNTAYSAGWQTRPKDFIGGLHNKSYTVKPNGANNYCIVVEFKPQTAKYFIPNKLNDFQNKIIDITEVWGEDAGLLSQKMRKEKTDSNKVKLIESFFLDRFIKPAASVIDSSIASILCSNGFLEIGALAANVGLSAAQFRKRFKEEIGIAPSQYCKIVRINTAMSLLRKASPKSLTELTYELGYFDQAHFIKDFKSVAGTSPKRFKQAI